MIATRNRLGGEATTAGVLRPPRFKGYAPVAETVVDLGTIIAPAAAPAADTATAPAAAPAAAPADTAHAVPGRRDVMDRLVRRFGWGGRPGARKALYEKLCDAVEVHGEPALDAIAESAAQATAARDPGRYFCATVCRKLFERGIVPGSDGDPNGADLFGRPWKRGVS